MERTGAETDLPPRAVLRALGLEPGDLGRQGPAGGRLRLDLLGREAVRPRACYVPVLACGGAAPHLGASAALAIADGLAAAGARAIATLDEEAAVALGDPAAAATLAELGGRHDLASARLLAGPPGADELADLLALCFDREDLDRRLAATGPAGRSEPLRAALQRALEPVLLIPSRADRAARLVHGGRSVTGGASVVADRLAMRCADWVLAAVDAPWPDAVERVCELRCRASGLRPRAVVLVCAEPAPLALARTVEAVRMHGLHALVALGDPAADLGAGARAAGAAAVTRAPVAGDGQRAARLLRELVEREPASFRFLSASTDDLETRLRAVAIRVLGADDLRWTAAARGLAGLVAPALVVDLDRPFGGADGAVLWVEAAALAVGAGFVRASCRLAPPGQGAAENPGSRSGPDPRTVDEADGRGGTPARESTMPEPVPPELSRLEDAFSPIAAAAPELQQTKDERRIAERVDLDAHARYRFPTIPAAGAWTQGVVVNLSETGGCFLVDGGWDLLERLESDEWVPLDVELSPPGERALRLRAEIIWVQPDHGGDGGLDRLGVRFDAADPDERARLHAFLDGLRAER